jgi:exosome complex RNA-binding protein Rrp42 (RNase PH superfamily)
MEEKIKLLERNEPRLYRSLVRIADYYVRTSKYISRYLNDENKEVVYKRFVTKLPENVQRDPGTYLVLRIGKYSLEDPTLKETYKDVEAECHIDETGKILAVYVER